MLLHKGPEIRLRPAEVNQQRSRTARPGFPPVGRKVLQVPWGCGWNGLRAVSRELRACDAHACEGAPHRTHDVRNRQSVEAAVNREENYFRSYDLAKLCREPHRISAAGSSSVVRKDQDLGR